MFFLFVYIFFGCFDFILTGLLIWSFPFFYHHAFLGGGQRLHVLKIVLVIRVGNCLE